MLRIIPPAELEKRISIRSIVSISVVLAAIILAVYMQVAQHEFVSYDDNFYVKNNPRLLDGLTGRNIVWAFTSFDTANWHPITWLSHLADVQLYGMNPRGHHLTSVVIHTATSVLLFLLFSRLTGSPWKSAFVAALFALHPLHVESVAWAAERKDVLSALFWFLTLHAYSEYVTKRKRALYILSLTFFVLGLMSKPMLVTLPVILLLIDFWPFNRFEQGEQEPGRHQRSARALALVKEKIPFFVCSLLSGIVTIYAQQKEGAMSNLKMVPFGLRCENALIAYVKYIIKTLWPHDLAVLYPQSSSFPLWHIIGSVVVLLLISAAVIRLWRQYPYLLTGWSWFLITLLPVIGLIQVGAQSMADRYSYIPLIGLFVMAAWGIPDLTSGLHYQKRILALLAGAVIIVSVVLTWHQIGYWRDSISLYTHTLNVTSGNCYIHINLGLALAEKGLLDEAMHEYQEALMITPNDPEIHYVMGFAHYKKGDFDAAIYEYQEALRINPGYSDAHNTMGLALSKKGDFDAAIAEYQTYLKTKPDNSDAHNNLGVALARKGDLEAAIQEFQTALQINPGNGKARKGLELTLSLRRQKPAGNK